MSLLFKKQIWSSFLEKQYLVDLVGQIWFRSNFALCFVFLNNLKIFTGNVLMFLKFY